MQKQKIVPFVKKYCDNCREKAAVRCQVTSNTIWRWLKEDVYILHDDGDVDRVLQVKVLKDLRQHK